jgi:hypothetical protein
MRDAKLLAGEYNDGHWLVLDVAGLVICDSRVASPSGESK